MYAVKTVSSYKEQNMQNADVTEPKLLASATFCTKILNGF